MLAIRLNHPAYDCAYLALAMAQARPFITADKSFVRKIQAGGSADMRKTVALLGAAAP